MKNQITRVAIMLLIISITLCNRGLAQYAISGQVADSTNALVSYATISFKNGSITRTVVSDSIGQYLLTKIQAGIYQMSCSYVGIEMPKGTINITRDTVVNFRLPNLGTTQLAGVTVTASKPLIQTKIDRLVFNVENSIYSKGLNAIEVLRETPRIEIGVDGGIKMIGKSGLRVMIDGRILNISDEDVKQRLMALRSEDIASIEVIPIPPAKYSAAGNSGLINIVLKKDPYIGWKGTLNAGYVQRQYPSFSQSGTINFKSKKN